MEKIKIRDLIIGDGTVKICLPMLGRDEQTLTTEAKLIRESPSDLVEWRVDYFEHANEQGQVLAMLQTIKRLLGPKPMIFTYRTPKEGGMTAIPESEYFDLNWAAMDSGLPDAVDIEFSKNKILTKISLGLAKKTDTKVIISSHIYGETPSQAELVQRLSDLQDVGGDISKLAVMTNDAPDGMRVISAAKEMLKEHAVRPFVAIGMGEHGKITRYPKPFFGSSITYARGSAETAPGQLSISELLGR